MNRRLGAAAALAQSGGRLHPACALWRVGVLDVLPAYLATGRRSLKGFAAVAGMTAVDWPVIATDPFANANTPAELAALQPLGDAPEAGSPWGPAQAGGCARALGGRP